MSVPHPIQADELPEVGDLLDSIFRRPRGVTDQHLLTDFPLVFCRKNARNSRVIKSDGRIVSHAAIWERELVDNEQTFKVAIVVSVATHPDHRRLGHAASLMKDLQRTLHEEAFDLGILWTMVPDFYIKLGWETVTPHGWLVPMDNISCSPAPSKDFKVEPFDHGIYLDQVLALYDQQPVRFTRTRDEARLLFTLPKVPVWVAKQEGQVVAYLVDGQATNKKGLTEYGGTLEGITTILNHLLTTQPSEPGRPLVVYHPRQDLLTWATNQGAMPQPLPSCKGMAHEMIYIVDRDRVTPRICKRLFVWGLDQA